jgi:uncharacterized protein
MEITSELIEKTAAYVKAKMLDEYTGHDWHHIERVWRTAKQIQSAEGGDLGVVELAALLHDLGDYKQYAFNEVKGSFILRGMMDVLEIEEELKEQLVKVIDDAQYVGEATKKASTLEGKILQDADWIDAVGAVGIARTFATGGHIGRVLHDPKKKPRENMGRGEYQFRKQEGTSFNYFFEKVLKLPGMMNTKTGQEMAEKRVKFLNEFLDEFKAEWDGNN